MTERKTPWTPGPWRDVGNIYGAKIVDPSGRLIITQGVALGSMNSRNSSAIRANARLIAAAPEMADIIPALIVVALDNLDDMNAETRAEVEKDIETARAVLAKARGEQ